MAFYLVLYSDSSPQKFIIFFCDMDQSSSKRPFYLDETQLHASVFTNYFLAGFRLQFHFFAGIVFS